MESKNSVRIALIGTGGMGRKYADLILFGRIPCMELTAMVCRSDNAKAWAADTLRTLPEGSESPRIFDSADALFAEPDLYDAVLIVTPHKTYPELAKRAFALRQTGRCYRRGGGRDVRKGGGERSSLFPHVPAAIHPEACQDQGDS